MRKYFALPILLLASVAFAQADLWEKKGVLGGSVQDIIRDTNLPSHKTIIATDSGFYASENLVDWTPVRTGFRDFSIRKMAWTPVDATTSAYAVMGYDGIYARASGWTDWWYADDAGLISGAGNVTLGYQGAVAVAFYFENPTLYVYLALHGQGIYRRSFNPSGATGPSADPWESPWVRDATYTYNPYISGMTNSGPSRLLVATIDVDLSNIGDIFSYNGSWTSPGVDGYDYLSIAGDPAAGGSTVVLAGTEANGVLISTGGGSFAPLCNQSTTLGPWKDLSLTKLPVGGLTYGTGTTGGTLYKLDPNDCANAYTPYTYFSGYSESVLTVDDNAALVGTMGMGLWYYPGPSSPGQPRGATGNFAIQNKNVTDIAIATSARRPDAPPVFFTASETDGLYKCFKPDYCTRYFFAPIPNRVGGVRGRSVALVPGYDEFGPVGYAAVGQIIASSKQDGGAGYAPGDTGTVSGCGNGQATYVIDSVNLASGEVTNYHIDLQGQGYDAPHNGCTTTKGGAHPGNGSGFTINITAVDTDIIGEKTLYLGTADYGVFRSDNGGASWKRLPAFPIDVTNGQSPEVVKIVVAPDFNPTTTDTTDKHMFVLTRDATILFSQNGGATWTIDANLNLSTELFLGEDLAISPAYNRGDPSSQVLFAATSIGVFKRVWITDHFEWQRNTEVNLPVLSVALSPCFGMGSCPSCAGADCAKEQSTVLLGTGGNGIYYSDNGGVNFKDMPIGSSCPRRGTTITALAMHPRTDLNDTTPAQRRLLAYVVKHAFSGNADLAVTALTGAPDPCPPGEFLTYTAEVKNNGPDPASGVMLEENLTIPPSVNLAFNAGGSTSGCVYDSLRKKVTCPIGNLAKDGTANIVTQFNILSGSGQLLNTASADSAQDDPNRLNNSMTIQTTIGAGFVAFSQFSSDIETPEPAATVSYLNAGFASPDTPELLYMRWKTDVPQRWECFNADPSDPDLTGFSDYMIRAVTFFPKFGSGTPTNWDVYAGHDYSGMWHAFHPPAINPPTDTTAWDRLDGFYNTPARINGIAECPDAITETNPHKMVLAGTEDYGTMISFDSGETYFPWGYGLEYVDTGKRYTLHNAEAVACTELFDPCGLPTPCGRHRILASGSECANFDGTGACLSKAHFGIYWGDWFTPDQQSRWGASTLDGFGMNGHIVPELRYCASTLPVYAADAGIGALYSNSGGTDAWGKDWHIDSAGDPPVDITDITCPGGQPGPTFGLRSLPGPRTGRSSFIWGAQSGLTQGFRALGAAKFKTSPSGSWQPCTDLSTTANWRSVIMLDTGTALIGDQGEDTNFSSGIYRNDQDGSTCSSWAAANTGFNFEDSSEITQNYSKKVIAFAKVSNGVLAALQQGGTGMREGGVFFSDTGSDGLAWVPVNSGMTCTSNSEVYSGSNIYTGSTCNGVYATDVITYTGYPTAYFTTSKSSDPWHENRVAFTNRSAGLVTSCSWTFGDSTGSTTCSPSHDYEVQDYLNATATLTGTNDATKADAYSTTVEIVDTQITGLTKVDEDTLQVTWAVPGGGKSYTYTLYRDTTAVGSGAAAVTGCTAITANTCMLDESSPEAYYKVKTSW